MYAYSEENTQQALHKGLTPEQSQKYQRHFGRHMILAIPKDPTKTKKEKKHHER